MNPIKTDRLLSKEEIKDIENWLANRPSATMDPCLNSVSYWQSVLRDRKSSKSGPRKPTNMMAAQNLSAANLQPIGKSFNGKIIC